MRPVLPGDVSTAARALLAVPKHERPALAHLLVARADMAHGFAQTWGRAHPVWGTGSLMSAALHLPCHPEPVASDPAYALALIDVLRAVVACQSDLPAQLHGTYSNSH
jgi:hypothetical protein